MRFEVVDAGEGDALATLDPTHSLRETVTCPCTASPPSPETCHPSQGPAAGLTSTLVGVASTAVGEPSIEAALTGAAELSAASDVPRAPAPDGSQSPPPLSWRPAEDVLPLVPEDVLPLAPVGEPTPGHVYVTYSRRHKTRGAAPAGAATLAEATDDFIDCIAHDLPTVLPTPAKPARRGRQPASSVPAPRCSRRIAKLPPEFDFQAKSSVAQALGFSEMELQTCDGKDKYSKFFGNSLCRRHVAALGACFGKELPEELPPASSIVVAVSS